MPGRHGESHGWRSKALVFTALLALPAGSAEAQSGQSQAISCASGQICTSSGADVAYLAPIVQEYVGPYLTANGIPGAEIGISWNGRRSYFGYGYSDLKSTLPYNPDTIVEIGSITKVFTTALFEEAVAENKLQLKGQLSTYAGVLGIPSLNWCGGMRNLQQLADFSSGMPRLPDVPNPAPDIHTYTVADFLHWLSGWTPNVAAENDPAKCEAGAGYLYSNTSVGILGILLAAVYDQPWFELVHRRIAVPLGMNSTFFDVPPAQAYRYAQGFAASGSAAPQWPVYAWFASGVLKSDAADMLSFGEAALGNGVVNGISAAKPAVGALEQAIASAIVPVSRPTVNGNTIGQGLAWVEVIPSASQSPIYVKNGGTSGFNTVIAVNKSKDLSVFVALPKSGTDAQKIGVDMVRAIGFNASSH